MALLAALSVLVAACSNPATPDPPPKPVRIVVRHDGTTRTYRVPVGTTIAQVLAKAKVEPAEGQLRSAGTKAPLGPNGNRAAIRLHGRPATTRTILVRASTLEVVDGSDTTEGTHTERRALAPEGLPKALQYVQFPGVPGREEVVLGDRSDEVVSRRTLTPAVPAHRATGPVLALTFDDGPDPSTTPEILRILEAKGVVATFCQVGTSVDAHPELTRRITDAGHQLCNHTQHHVEGLEAKPAATIESEIAGGKQAIVDGGAEAVPFYRPPGGSLAPVIYDAAAKHHESVLYWSIDPRDWKRPPPGDIVSSVVTQLRPGAIILLHDGGGDRSSTVAALPAIIDFARALGYTFTAPLSNRPQVG